MIILACTALYGFYRELQEELEVPVIDSMIAGSFPPQGHVGKLLHVICARVQRRRLSSN
ncbi:MAG: hypothetical protein V3V80_05340 [Dehalococcoidia bacterium]